MNFQQIAKAGFKIFQQKKLQEMKKVEPLKLRSYSEEESGYCRYNPQINAYASESPENLAEVLIFVVATQQVRWPDVVSKFPNLMNYIYANNGLFKAGEKRNEEGFPSTFSSITRGKTDAIDAIWKNKDGIFSKIGPIIREYNNSSSAQKEDAAFKLYLNLLRVPRLGLPKAGFAAQLIIGRFGCIDSINSNILELPKGIVGPDNKFKSPGKTKVQAGEVFADLTKGGVEMAKKYADYLKHLEETIKDDISKILWDNWCDIVAYKIKNPRSEFDVELQGGLKGGRVESDYPRVYDPSNPSSGFMKRFGSDITGQEVSKQHHPEFLKLALKERTANFIEKMYGDTDYSSMTLQEKKMKRVALALKNKVVGETSTMGGGAVEGGPTKPAFGSATRKMREPHHKLKGRPLHELNEAELNEVLEEGMSEILQRLKSINLRAQLFIANNWSKVQEAVKEFFRIRVELRKNINNVDKLKKLLKQVFNKFGTNIFGAVLALAYVAAGVMPPASSFALIGSSQNIDTVINNLEPSTIANAIGQAASDALTEYGTDKKDIYAHTAGLGRGGFGATGLEYDDEEEEEAIVEYLTEAEAATKKPHLGKVTRNPSGSKKKFHVYVKCSGRVKKISFGDPNLSIKRDSPERRKSFRARHKCDKPEGKNRCTARYWSCYQWRAGAKVKSEE